MSRSLLKQPAFQQMLKTDTRVMVAIPTRNLTFEVIYAIIKSYIKRIT